MFFSVSFLLASIYRNNILQSYSITITTNSHRKNYHTNTELVYCAARFKKLSRRTDYETNPISAVFDAHTSQPYDEFPYCRYIIDEDATNKSIAKDLSK